MTETPADLVQRARTHDARAIARLISWVEDASPKLEEALESLPADRTAYTIGITGSPGVGKSTATSALVSAYRARGLAVAVLAVDPSSPFTGGALLGDRIRMKDHAGDPGVYIRSMASRGQLGGLAAATPQAVRVLEAVGFDVILIETVGVGQSEVDIAAAADATVVLLAPGMGDGIQAAKAGILEIGDVLCVNKADRDGASATVREVRQMLQLGPEPDGWCPPVVTSVAAQGEVGDLVAALDERRDWLAEGDRWAQRRTMRAQGEILALALGSVREEWGALLAGPLSPEVARVADGSLSPQSVVAQLLGRRPGMTG